MKSKLVTMQAFTAEVREETLDGRAYLVAPVVAVVNGVMNGKYVSTDEIVAVPVDLWNDIPLPVAHPKVGSGSARTVEVIEDRVVGRFYNARYVTTGNDVKLKGELWVDVEKALAIGDDGTTVVNRLREGKPLEVSTAYFNDEEEAVGVFNGDQYTVIAHNLKPDHLALLPAEIGACSWADGCGAPRFNTKEPAVLMAKDANGVVTIGEPVGVEREISYTVAQNKESKMKQNKCETGTLEKIKTFFRGLGVNTMNREEMVAALVEGGVDAAVLEGATDEAVALLYERSQPAVEPVVDPVEPVAPVVEPVVETIEPVAEPVAAPVTNAETLIDGIKLGEIVKFVKDRNSEVAAEREGLVASLVANERCTISKESLNLMPPTALKELVANFAPGNYSGVGLPHGQKQTVPVAPAVVLAKAGE